MRYLNKSLVAAALGLFSLAGSVEAGGAFREGVAGLGVTTGAGIARGSSSSPTLIRWSRSCWLASGMAVSAMRSENARHFIIFGPRVCCRAVQPSADDGAISRHLPCPRCQRQALDKWVL